MSLEPSPPELGTLAAASERVRLLEHQIEYVRAEMLHLTRERETMIYSASWRVFHPLRRLEAKLVDAFAAWRRKLEKPAPAGARAKPAAEARAAAQGRGSLPARRLLIDVTGTVTRDAAGGIERVVKNVARALHGADDLGIPALAVRCDKGRLFACHAFVASLTGAPAARDVEIDAAPGDRFLMLSDSWNVFDEYAELLERVRSRGGEIISCVFDLIPELYPYACHEATVPRYRAWLRRTLLESDAVLAISRTVAEELAAFVRSRALPHRAGLKIGWFHCGSDIATAETGVLRPKIQAAVEGSAPVFLCVGTLEPRKGHRTAIKAFEELWNEGAGARLALVGKRGWYDEALVREILSHPRFGELLCWFDDVSDAELSFLYGRASAIVLPSYAEGFGLPIAEAARRGRPVICSDIPVFREVGGEGAAYFRVNDASALASCLRDWLAGRIETDVSKISRGSWMEAARRIVTVIAREEWSRRLP